MSKKAQEYQDYLVKNNIKDSVEMANCFYVAYATGYANSSEDNYNESDKSEMIVSLKTQLAEKQAERDKWYKANDDSIRQLSLQDAHIGKLQADLDFALEDSTMHLRLLIEANEELKQKDQLISEAMPMIISYQQHTNSESMWDRLEAWLEKTKDISEVIDA